LKSIGSKKKENLRATTNPAGMDLIDYEMMGIEETSEFYKNQIRIIECLSSMGLENSWSCSAWLHSNLPYNTHVAFAESHLSCFVNSQGIRTNRESGASALYSAIIGKTPNYGYHLAENRKPTITIEVEDSFKEDSSAASALGYWIGRELRKEAEESVVVPFISGNTSWLNTLYHQESVAAGLASNSKINCFHIDGKTRESVKERFHPPLEKIIFTKTELTDTYDLLSDPIDDVDIIFIGCPHLSPKQSEEVYSHFKRKSSKRCWVFTGRDIYQSDSDHLKFFYDTCLVVSPLKQMGIESVATNSAKAAHYLRAVHGLETVFTDLSGLLKISKEGITPKIHKSPDLTLYKEEPKERLYLCPNENEVVNLDIFGSRTESTAFGSVAVCPYCRNFVFKIS
jgi:predicted aconitase